MKPAILRIHRTLTWPEGDADESTRDYLWDDHSPEEMRAHLREHRSWPADMVKVHDRRSYIETERAEILAQDDLFGGAA